VSLLVVRHADAGDRAAWTGDDRRRPLSATGRRQAEALVVQYDGRPIERILSSPAVRCVATVEPLAASRGLVVEEEDALAEGASFDVVDRLLRRMAALDVVVCSHGDVIGDIVTTLRRGGTALGSDPAWRKATTWVMDTWPDPKRAELLPDPDVP
jgi:8-oxo-(d)GTP phosphatase